MPWKPVVDVKLTVPEVGNVSDPPADVVICKGVANASTWIDTRSNGIDGCDAVRNENAALGAPVMTPPITCAPGGATVVWSVIVNPSSLYGSATVEEPKSITTADAVEVVSNKAITPTSVRIGKVLR